MAGPIRTSASSTTLESASSTCRRSWPATSSGTGATARGTASYDAEGKAYLDFATGIATTILGHRHPRGQRGDPRAGGPAAPHHVRPRLHGARLAAGRDGSPATLPDPLDRVFFGNSGAEVDRRRAEARAPSDRAAGDHRLPGRLPRPDLRRAERHHVEPELPARPRPAAARRPPGALPTGVPRLWRRRCGCRCGIASRAIR